jgi:hypothetical protein
MSPPGWVAVGITVAVMASAMATIVFSLVRPDLMLVEHVVFEGQHRSTVQSLRHLSDVHEGTRVWEVDLGETANALERHPWVKKARVHRVWPDQLRVELEEHEPTAVLVYEGLFLSRRFGGACGRSRGLVWTRQLESTIGSTGSTGSPRGDRFGASGGLHRSCASGWRACARSDLGYET